MSIETGMWPEQEAIIEWWGQHSLELKEAVTGFRLKVQKERDDYRARAEKAEARVKELEELVSTSDECEKCPLYWAATDDPNLDGCTVRMADRFHKECPPRAQWREAEARAEKAEAEVNDLKFQLAAVSEGLRKGPTHQLWMRAEKTAKQNKRLREALALFAKIYEDNKAEWDKLDDGGGYPVFENDAGILLIEDFRAARQALKELEDKQ